MKKNVISTITKSLPIEFSSLVNYSLLVTLCYINLFWIKISSAIFNGTIPFALIGLSILFYGNHLLLKK